MPLSPTHDDFRRALALLGLRHPVPGGEEGWRETALRPAWLAAVKRQHPDAAGPNVSAAEAARRTAATGALNVAYALLRTLRVVPRAPPSPFVVTVVSQGFSPSSATFADSGMFQWGGDSDVWGRGGPLRGTPTTFTRR